MYTYMRAFAHICPYAVYVCVCVHALKGVYGHICIHTNYLKSLDLFSYELFYFTFDQITYLYLQNFCGYFINRHNIPLIIISNNSSLFSKLIIYVYCCFHKIQFHKSTLFQISKINQIHTGQ
jgi:hypothetical protein